MKRPTLDAGLQKKQPRISHKYHCKCGGSTFTLEPRRVKGTWGMDSADVLICTSCKEKYYIEPCSTGGLTRHLDDLPRKEVFHVKRTPEELYRMLCSNFVSSEMEDLLQAIELHPDTVKKMLVEGIANKKASGMEDN